MAKAMFGIAAALALITSPAWAGDEKSDGKAAGDTVARAETSSDGKSTNVTVSDSAARGDLEAGRDSRIFEESAEVRAAHEAEWLRMREGYRDGGY